MASRTIMIQSVITDIENNQDGSKKSISIYKQNAYG